MMTAKIWPDGLYLLCAGAAQVGHDASPQTMGAKAFNLWRMAQMGLPVPPALVIGARHTAAPEKSLEQVFERGLPALEKVSGRRFGDGRMPLIVSVRSGAPLSMPGMMETLLNVGLCDATLPGMLRLTGNPRLVWDAYRRLVASYGEIVAGLPPALFEETLQIATSGGDERQLDFSELRDLTRSYLALYQREAGKPFPQDTREQLTGAIRAVFASWHADKAVQYRKSNHIDAAIGTAVAIQSMVFGNAGGRSGAGVGFTRDPTSGEKRLWVDFLANAQGEDVVSGRRNAHGHEVLAMLAPGAWWELEAAAARLEREFGDMQDFEFTVQEGALHMLQTRSGKRTAVATARIALDLLDEGVINTAAALAMTSKLEEAQLCAVRLASSNEGESLAAPLATATPAAPGVVSGVIVLDAARAAARAVDGADLVLVRQDAETADIAALEASRGLLTRRGARTSHAAVVARQLGRVCLVGCESLRIDLERRTLQFGDREFKEGDLLTLDGNSGAVYAGVLAAVSAPEEELLRRLRVLRAGLHQA